MTKWPVGMRNLSINNNYRLEHLVSALTHTISIEQEYQVKGDREREREGSMLMIKWEITVFRYLFKNQYCYIMCSKLRWHVELVHKARLICVSSQPDYLDSQFVSLRLSSKSQRVSFFFEQHINILHHLCNLFLPFYSQEIQTPSDKQWLSAP